MLLFLLILITNLKKDAIDFIKTNSLDFIKRPFYEHDLKLNSRSNFRIRVNPQYPNGIYYIIDDNSGEKSIKILDTNANEELKIDLAELMKEFKLVSGINISLHRVRINSKKNYRIRIHCPHRTIVYKNKN